MINLTKFLEALPLSLAKKYVKMSKGQYETMYDELFEGENRIYIPLKYDTSDINESPIEDYLKDQGYDVDYDAGYAYKNKQKYKIGRILNKEKPEWLDIYKKDPIRQKSQLMIVISRHPYDIAGMSTDRHWDSCMDLYTGSNRQFVQKDIEEGTIIAYLISANDKNIEHPLARVLIKPYIQKEI